jgi:hypothetical protein
MNFVARIHTFYHIPEVKSLVSKCPGVSNTHAHIHAWGSMKREGKTLRKASLAGRYLTALCEGAADCVLACRERLGMHN